MVFTSNCKAINLSNQVTCSEVCKKETTVRNVTFWAFSQTSRDNSEKISIIEDYEKGLGPLGGVLSAMKWIKENQKDYKWIATFPVDTPFLRDKYLKILFKKLILMKVIYFSLSQ